MLDFLTDAFAWAQQTLFEQVVQPLVFAWGFGDLLEKAFDGTGWRPAERLPVARELGETSLMFLVHPTLGVDEIGKTCEVLADVMRQAAR